MNACDRAKSGKVLASGDDFGKVNLYRYPVVSKEPEGHNYRGHSSHVTNVRFTCDDRYVLSTGGADLSIFQWRHRGEGVSETPNPASEVIIAEKVTAGVPAESSDANSATQASSTPQRVVAAVLKPKTQVFPPRARFSLPCCVFN